MNPLKLFRSLWPRRNVRKRLRYLHSYLSAYNTQPSYMARADRERK